MLIVRHMRCLYWNWFLDMKTFLKRCLCMYRNSLMHFKLFSMPMLDDITKSPIKYQIVPFNTEQCSIQVDLAALEIVCTLHLWRHNVMAIFYFEIYNICTSSVGSIHAMVNKASFYFMQLIVVNLYTSIHWKLYRRLLK